MKIRRILSVVLVSLMLLSMMNFAALAEENAVAMIGEKSYTDLGEAFSAATDGDTIELMAGTFELGEVKLPASLLNVTVKGAADKATVIKNSSIISADAENMNYTGITIDGVVFENSYITLTDLETSEAVYKDWTITNCEFLNIVTPGKNTPAVNYSSKAKTGKMNGFTFTNNVLDGVSGKSSSGFRVISAAGKVLISNNTIKNVEWNAMQIQGMEEFSVVDSEEPPILEISNNIISDIGAKEGMLNFNDVKCEIIVTGNTITRKISKQPYLCYVNTALKLSENTWIDENGNKIDDEAAQEGIYKVVQKVGLAKAIDRLKSLGIAKGTTKKKFGENEKVTREQMAAFIYRFMNKGVSLEDAENTSSFTDLKEPIFYGMIAWANDKGIIKGVSETEFNPTGGITLQDCYAMVLRALGYEEGEDLTYPDGYISLAKKLRISENVKETENEKELTRGDVAIILYNALYADMKDGGNAATKIYERHPLDGKKVLFVGSSFTYHGYTVFRKSRTILNIETRRDDMGYFYQLAKTNGAEPAVTNWTWGGHSLRDTFAEKCTANRECKGLEHLAHFTDYDYDYVFLQESGPLSLTNPDGVISTAEKFKAVNPDVKIFVLVPSSGYFNGEDGTECLSKIEETGITVVNWGKLVVDIANGNVEVPGAKEAYNKNSFIVSLSEDDGYHQNLLTGYIISLMAYCAVTGESAVGQDYAFCSDTSINSTFNFDTYKQEYYVYDNATTNFPQIFASESDMKGIQQLADKYLGR